MKENPSHAITGQTLRQVLPFSDSESLRSILSNKALPLEERLEAFEDIMDSEVGDTTLVRARNLERTLGIRQLFLKFEGGNPTGSQKDRIAFAQCMDALRRGYDAVAVATCGNYGVSVALAAALAGLTCHVFVPEAYHTRRIKEMESLGAKIYRHQGDYETTVAYSQGQAVAHEWYDANPGGQNTLLQLQAYGEIAFEIYDELRDAPRMVAVPFSNGTVLAGIYKGFLRLYRRGKTSHQPIMVGGSAAQMNPITASFSAGQGMYTDLSPEKIKETPVNEPLINWHAFDGEWALEALTRTGGFAADISDRKMIHLTKMLKDQEGIHVLPAATAGLSRYHLPWYSHTDQFSSNGVIGDPTKGNPQKGKWMWEMMLSHLVALIEGIKPLSPQEIFQRRY